MLFISDDERRRAFSMWLRSGRLPAVRNAEGIEFKFNRWHDPENGRFTFAPGGARGRAGRFVRSASGRQSGKIADADVDLIEKRTAEAGSTFGTSVANQVRPPTQPRRPGGSGGNIRAFEIPMTLEQAVPGLRNSPGGAVLAIADNLFDIFGPGNRVAAELLSEQSEKVIREIKAIDPTWHYEGLGPVGSVEGHQNKLNELRFTRAAVLLRVRQDVASLQVETLRFMQERTDKAYDLGMTLLQSGKLKIRLSSQESLGNYIDQRVRREIRERYNQVRIDAAGKGPVRVNRREYDSAGSELTHRRPDARVGGVAFDVTLTGKTLRTPQIRGFFSADFRPQSVVIIRPRQLGTGSSYIIVRPESE